MPVPIAAIVAGTSLVSSVAGKIGSARTGRLQKRKTQIQSNLQERQSRAQRLQQRAQSGQELRGETKSGIKFRIAPPRQIEVESAFKAVESGQKDLARIEKMIQKPKAANIIGQVANVGSFVTGLLADPIAGSGVAQGFLGGAKETLAKGSGVAQNLIEAVTNPKTSKLAKGIGVASDIFKTVQKGGGVASAIGVGLGSAKEAGFLPGRAGEVAGIATSLISNIVPTAPTRGMSPVKEPTKLAPIGIQEIQTGQIPDIIRRKGQEAVDRIADRLGSILPGEDDPSPKKTEPLVMVGIGLVIAKFLGII